MLVGSVGFNGNYICAIDDGPRMHNGFLGSYTCAVDACGGYARAMRD